MKLYPILVLILGLTLTTSCKKDDEGSGNHPMESLCDNPFCNVEPNVINSGLNITFLDHELAVPKSKYSVYFKVDEESGPVTDLVVDDVVVKDNGQVIEFESANELTPDPQSFGFHIALLVDLSESVTESEVLPQVKEAMSAFVNTILPDSASEVGETFVSIYYFDGDPDLVVLQDFTKNADELLSTIDNISADLTRDNSTNLNGAFISGASIIQNRVDRSPKLVDVGTMVVFTDGDDLAGLSTFQEASDAVQGLNDDENQIDVYTIGLGQSVDSNVLQQLGYSGYYSASNFNSLTPTFEDIAAELNAEVNSYYKLEYCSPRRAGQTEIIIEVSKNNLSGKIESCINSDCTPDPC